MAFSRRTLSALAQVLSSIGHSELDVLFFRYGIDAYDVSGGLVKRAVAFMKAIETSRASQESPDEIVLELLGEIPTQIVPWGGDATNRLEASLALDGYEYANRQIRPILPVQIGKENLLSGVEADLSTNGFLIATAHYQQAIANYTSGNHEAANGQLRSAMEAFFNEAPSRVGGRKSSDAVAGLQQLRELKRIDKSEEMYARSYWNIIQDSGPHAGLTTEEEASFRLHTGSALLRLMISKLSR